jgi:hypothetical protein
MAKDTTKIGASDEAWESGELGRDEEFVKVSKEIDESKLDQSLGLVPVSIRLQKSLIEDFKLIARYNGIGYQPLMRQILTRFADCEKKRILRDLLADAGRVEEEDAELDEPELKRA